MANFLQSRKIAQLIFSEHKVLFNGKSVKLKEFLADKNIRPKGRQMARTFSVIRHDLPLEITIERRINKHGNESFVFQASTYKALPASMLRSIKNDGLSERSLDRQNNISN